MDRSAGSSFDLALWGPALEKSGAVVQLSVALYGLDGRIVCGPVPTTSIFAVFQAHGYRPCELSTCVQSCLAQSSDHRPTVVITAPSGLAVVGTSLVLDGLIVGALVAGYAPVAFTESVAIARLAREVGTPFESLWAIVRRQQPVPMRRLVVYGELLQVLGDTLLRENSIRQQSEQTTVELNASAKAKEEFLAVLSHELRTPLTPILGWTSILKRQHDPKVVHAAEVIERNAVFQLRLVEDLLELTRATRGKLTLNLKLICLDDLLRVAVEAVIDVARKKGVALRFIDAPEPLCLRADGDRMQQVLRNVLVNALKFTPGGGTVTVTLTRDGDDGVVHILDTGEGIAAEFLPHVFGMFEQQERGTRRTHAGLGIGLALVKQLTEAHGGVVSIASDGVGRGTRVTLRFPLAAEPMDAQAQPRSLADDALALSGLRILVVEDTEDALDALGMTLERFGAEVLSARDGIEGLERAAGNDLDLILCDLRMPRMDGFEFLRELYGDEARQHPPVIAVSGLASSADHMATQAAGFAAHIDKPFDDIRLLEAVGGAMAHRFPR